MLAALAVAAGRDFRFHTVNFVLPGIGLNIVGHLAFSQAKSRDKIKSKQDQFVLQTTYF